MSPLVITLIIFGVTVIMFFSGKFGLGLIGLCAAVALQLCGIVDANTVWANFTNSSVIMFVSLFVLSAGLMKTSLINRFVQKLSTVQGNERKVLWGCLTITILLAIFMNATAAVATMLPMISIICEKSNVNPRKIMKPCCDTANIWVGALPMGVGASAYLTTNAMIEQMGGTQTMGILDYFIIKAPVLIVVSLYYYFVVTKLLPNELPTEMKKEAAATKDFSAQISPTKEIITYVLFFGTVVCMILGSLLGWKVPTYMMPVISGILMVLTGVLTPKEAAKSIPINMILLIGGMLTVATALGSTGGAAIMGEFVTKLLGGSNSSVLILAVLFIVPCIMTQFMNNIPVAQAFTPIAIATCMAGGADPRLGCAAVSFAATASILTPMASVAQAMCMGPGEYKITHYLKSAGPALIIYFIVLMLWSPIAAKLLWGV